MRQHAADGDRHAALRQFDRMDRALRRELGVSPGRDAIALRDHLLSEPDAMARSVATDAELIGRAKDVEIAELALLDAAAGRGRTLIVSGPPGVGKTVLLEAITKRARALSFRVGAGTRRSGRRCLAVCARRRGARRRVPAPSHVARRPRRPSPRGDRPRARPARRRRGPAGSSHQRLFVAVAELVRLASGTHGLLLTIDDIHDADDASLRLLHYVSRSTASERVCIVLSHRTTPMSETLAETRHSLLDRHSAAAIELGPLNDEEIGAARRSPRRRRVGRAARSHHCAQPGRCPFAVNELARRAAAEPHWVQALDANMVTGIEPATREVLQRVAIVGSTFDTDEFVALVRSVRGRRLRPSRPRPRCPRRRAVERRIPLPSRARARCAARRPASPSPAPHPPRCRRTAHRARRLCGTRRPSPPRVGGRRRRRALSASGRRD